VAVFSAAYKNPYGDVKNIFIYVIVVYSFFFVPGISLKNIIDHIKYGKKNNHDGKINKIICILSLKVITDVPTVYF